MPARRLTVADHHRQFPFAVLPEALPGFEQMLGVEPGLDALGQLDLVGRIEQRGLADAVQIHAHQVGGWALSVQIAVNPACGGICHSALPIGLNCHVVQRPVHAMSSHRAAISHPLTCANVRAT
jgi:hypothetical protein